MILILLLYIFLPASIAVVLYFLGVRSRRFLMGVPAGFLTLPILLVLGLYLFRVPIQQGKILAGLGPVLSLVFPAHDLYEPLAGVEIQLGKGNYKLTFIHKYVGRHAVRVDVPGRFGIEKLGHDLRITLRLYDDQTLLYETGPGEGGQFWGRDHYGLYFVKYRVPQDAPAGVPLTADIHISGDLGRFLKDREGTTLKITKMSDE